MEREIHETTDEARAGSTPNIVRYVLGISILLAAIAMTIVWVTGAWTFDGEHGGDTGQATTMAQPSPDSQRP